MKDAAVSSPAAESSPAGKKLVQARLPFKVVSPASPKTPPIARKRKLSAQPSESASKINKLSKENEASDDPVLISDDESDTQRLANNPYLNIVDKAIKKKLQKKTPRKKKSKEIANVIEKDGNLELSVENTNDSKTPSKAIVTVDEELVIFVDQKSNNDTVKHLEQTEHKNELNRISEDKPSITPGDCEIMDVDEAESENDKISNTIKNKRSKEMKKTLPSKPGAHANQMDSDIDESKLQKCDNKLDIIEVNDSDIEIVEKTKLPESSLTTEPKDTPKSKEDLASISTDQNNRKSSDCADPHVTPKRRSNRTKNAPEKHDTSLNNLQTKKDDEVTTPKQSSKKTGSSSESLELSSPVNTAVTPKQMQRRLESAKKREEKEKEKQEREMKRLQEKEERNKVRLEKEEQKRKEKEDKEEQKRKEREEKEDQRRKEKEEKERQKELEKKEREEKEELKRKEKEEKEEQKKKEKEAREEEKRKKLELLEEEKRQKELEKQEQEIKKKKAAAAFANFFVAKQKADLAESSTSSQSKSDMLSSFAVKSDMRLAPTVRNYIDCDQKKSLEDDLGTQQLPQNKLYLQSLKDKVIQPRTNEKTWPLDDKEEDCMIVEAEEELPAAAGPEVVAAGACREWLRPKLLSFHENRRPPYWGTWRKRSAAVRARRPFATDTKQLDYEVDSESEWEEEGEGESIAGSAAGSVDEERDEYEVDNDFFVPHGYLSDEEATMDGDDVFSLSPETQKMKLKHLEDEFESEMKKPTEKLKPRLYGMLWENSEGGKPDNCVDPLWNYFGKMTMILDDPTPLLQPPPEIEKPEKKKKKSISKAEDTPKASPKSTDKRKRSKPVKKDVPEVKKTATEPPKNQPGINAFLTKIKST